MYAEWGFEIAPKTSASFYDKTGGQLFFNQKSKVATVDSLVTMEGLLW